MNDHDDDLPRYLDELRMEHFRNYPHRPMSYEPALVARIVGYIWARRLHNETLEQCSQKLCISVHQLRRWLLKSGRKSCSSAPAAAALPLLRPVTVAAEMVRVPDGVAEKRYTLRSPAGYQVRGLRLEELIVLLRGLT